MSQQKLHPGKLEESDNHKEETKASHRSDTDQKRSGTDPKKRSHEHSE